VTIEAHRVIGESRGETSARGYGREEPVSKLSMVRMLLGFEAPAAGTVSYDGRDLAELDMAAVRRQIGTVIQTARLLDAGAARPLPRPSLANDVGRWPCPHNEVGWACRRSAAGAGASGPRCTVSARGYRVSPV
jgi:hypothetical protein